MNENGTFQIRYHSLAPKQDMRELEGYLEELLDPSFYERQKREDYLKITLHDEGALLDPINKLRQVYPNVLHLERKMALADLKKSEQTTVQREEKSPRLSYLHNSIKR